ncbi:ABC transporter ATP-binding protein [Nocardioides yefusunii]|uniref:ABC transporter ATP-binding protein n=1 Tax=Nocardioides yefusunii TaxID=2500546 RepID=A0ABW1QV54_9ACTN|nr:ATP-binding cassette domain-containing protein [Nocardioides yefusunii]
MLTGTDLSFRWSRRGPWILHEHAIEVAPGEVVGLRGPSGSGKSTLAAVLAGLQRPASGTVLVDDEPLASFTGASPVQVVLQHPDRAMNPRWTIREVLAEALPLRRREALVRVDEIVAEDWARHGLVNPDWLGRHPHEISGGELQRVNLLRALCAEPRYLLADEISASLDAITQTVLWHRIEHEVKSRRIGVLAVSHDSALLEQVADRIVDFRTP